jgi:uncharacterized zinc-type alcohol dehydrogenase-like protein
MTIERREPGAHDVQLEILFCGICHSDIHQARDEWGGSAFPMVPGHEIVGRVVKAGAQVTRFKAGDLLGVGCLVDSCRTCDPCKRGTEQFCDGGAAWTYNGTEMDRRTPTQGGYSKAIVVDEQYALRIPAGMDPAATAPLLCAGITTYSPLRRFGCKKGDRVAVAGLGGLGHMAVKLAAAMGAEVTVLSTSRKKAADAQRLGAAHFEVTSDKGTFGKLKRRFDLIIDTVSAEHDYADYLALLRPFGNLVIVGVPPNATPLETYPLIGGNRSLTGSLIGGIPETQEMLDFCAAHHLAADIELTKPDAIDSAWDRTVKSDVRYRFVIQL